MIKMDDRELFIYGRELTVRLKSINQIEILSSRLMIASCLNRLAFNALVRLLIVIATVAILFSGTYLSVVICLVVFLLCIKVRKSDYVLLRKEVTTLHNLFNTEVKNLEINLMEDE